MQNPDQNAKYALSRSTSVAQFDVSETKFVFQITFLTYISNDLLKIVFFKYVRIFWENTNVKDYTY